MSTTYISQAVSITLINPIITIGFACIMHICQIFVTRFLFSYIYIYNIVAIKLITRSKVLDEKSRVFIINRAFISESIIDSYLAPL